MDTTKISALDALIAAVPCCGVIGGEPQIGPSNACSATLVPQAESCAGQALQSWCNLEIMPTGAHVDVGEDVCPGQLAGTGHSTALAVTTPASIVQKECMMKQRRAAQELHHHKQIWSKTPHGGPYYKVTCKTDTLASAHALSSALITLPENQQEQPGWLTLGYERVKIGPTTNIVGDAMSQAAVDSVHSQLQQPNKGSLELHWMAQARVEDTAKVQSSGNPDDAVHNEEQEETSKQARARFQAVWCKLQAQGKAPEKVAPPAKPSIMLAMMA